VYIRLSRKRVAGNRLNRKKRNAVGFGNFRTLKKKPTTKVHRQKVLLVIRNREIQRLMKARRLRSSFQLGSLHEASPVLSSCFCLSNANKKGYIESGVITVIQIERIVVFTGQHRIFN